GAIGLRSGIAHDGRRTGIGHLELDILALNLLGDVEQIARIEADLDRSVLVAHFELFDGSTVFRAGRRDDEIAAVERQLYGAAALGRDRRDTVDRVGEFLALDIEDLALVDRDDALV